ncbi:MAG: flagellar hook-associated protein FlgK, partial [Lachnospiraceae bacterium]|nr:flagellar hook-associated protein FlgK [Lachnospiraceae bacterium]
MPSQFFGLNIAYTGLLNANAGLNTTANNISNAETEGYSRQGINSQAAEALRVFTTYGCAGAGVETLSIERIHDEFYDNKYWDNNTKTGHFEMKDYYMKQIEDYFRDDSTIEGFTTTFNKMMTALAEVKKNPANISTKAQFVGFADNLCEYFNSMANSMEQVQKDVNSEIKLKVDEINSIASEIATINKQINVIELSGGTANELRDKRTLLVDELSSIVSVDAKEYPIIDSNNPERETGGHMYIVKIAGGQTLVDTGLYNTLECVARTSDEKVNQSDIDGLYDVYWISSANHAVYEKIMKEDPDLDLTWNEFVKFGYQTDLIKYEPCDEFNMYNASLGGQLEGLKHMRDGNNAENFKGTITEIGDATTSSGITTRTIKV